MTEPTVVLDYVQVLIWPLLLFGVSLVAARLVSRVVPRRAEQPPLRANVQGAFRDGATRLTAALEDSDWLAALGSSPPPNAAVHLQQAARVNPSTYRESARQIHESLRHGRVVILDLASTDEQVAARLIDFCSATMLASNGVLQQLASTVLILTPHSD